MAKDGLTERIPSTVEREYSNQNWRRVLRAIVNYAPNKFGRGEGNFGEDHPIVNRLKINPRELMLIMAFLLDMGLIEYEKPDLNWIIITPKGFDVALKNRDSEREFRSDMVTVFFTAIVAFAAILPFFHFNDQWVGGIVILGFITLLYFEVRVMLRRGTQ